MTTAEGGYPRTMALPRERGPDLSLFAIATFQALFGLVVAYWLAPQLWLADATRNLAAAADMVAGRFGSDPVYLYSPLAAALTIPATLVPAAVAGAGWLVLRVGVVVACVRRATAGRTVAEQVIVLVAVLAFVPVVVDLMLGNVSILLAGAVALVAWAPDRGRNGILLGLALATVPKPALIPILIWMALYRRRALIAAIVTAGLLTAGAVAVLGLGVYQSWFETLRHPYYLGGSGAGNLSIGALVPDMIGIPLQVVSVIAALVALRRGETAGLVGAIAVGLLVAPYTMAYGAVFLLIVVGPIRRVVPASLMTIGAMAAPAISILFLPVLAGSVLALAAFPRSPGWPRLDLKEYP